MKNYLFIICLLLFSCAESDIQPDLPDSENKISLLTSSAVPGELVIAQFDIQPSQDTATIWVGDKKTMSFRADSNQVMFIMPELPAKTPAVIQFKGMGISQQVTIMVGEYEPITQPENVFVEYTISLDKAIQNYDLYEKSELVKLDPAYGELFKYAKQQLTTQFATLTLEQKKEIAYTFRAYPLNPHEVRLDTLNADYFISNRILYNPFGDPEEKFASNVKIFLRAVWEAKHEIAIGGLMIAGSTALAPVVAIPMAFTGALILLDGLKSQIDINAAYYNSTLDKASVRILDTEIENLRLSDGKIFLEEKLKLENDVAKKVILKGAFRTIIQDDVNSNSPTIKQFFEANEIMDESYENFLSKYSEFEKILGGDAPSLPAQNKPVRTDGGSKKIPMQLSKLSVTNISNDAIVLSLSGEGIDISIKAKSTTITEPETDFTFDLVYTSILTGEKVIDKINATFILSLEDYLINNSPWKLIYRVLPDRDDFQLWNAGNIACGPNGVLYDHKQKILNGTFSFNPGVLFINTNWERHTYNCNTNSYDITEYPDSVTFQWKIDENSGQLILYNDDGSFSSTLTVSGNKVTIISTIEEGQIIQILEK